MFKETLANIRDSILLPLLVFATVATLALTLLWTAVTPFSWIHHARDRAELSQIDSIIAVYEEEYTKTIKDILLVKEGSNIRFNADTPVASLIENRVAISSKLIESKLEKNRILTSIISRCNSPFGLTVYFFDNKDCSEYRTMG